MIKTLLAALAFLAPVVAHAGDLSPLPGGTTRYIYTDGVGFPKNNGKLDALNNFYGFGSTGTPSGFPVRVYSLGAAVIQSTAASTASPVFDVRAQTGSSLFKILTSGTISGDGSGLSGIGGTGGNNTWTGSNTFQGATSVTPGTGLTVTYAVKAASATFGSGATVSTLTSLGGASFQNLVEVASNTLAVNGTGAKVYTSGNFVGDVFTNSLTVTGGSAYYDPSATENVFNAASGDGHRFTVNAANVGKWTSTGLGIGTVTPVYALHVSSGGIYTDGTTTADGLTIGISSFVVKNSGFTGVGTATPGTKLHMSSGTLTVDGTNAQITTTGGVAADHYAAGSTFTGAVAYYQPGPSNGILNVPTGGSHLLTVNAANVLTLSGSALSIPNTVTAAFASTTTHNAQLIVNVNNSTGTIIKGWSNLVGAGTGNASIQLGANNAAGARIDMDSSSSGVLHIENENDGVTNNIQFGVRQNNTAGFYNATALSISGGGIITSSSTIPSVACNAGTGVIAAPSTNNHGRFTAGAGAANCTVTFANAFPKTPQCWCNDETNIVLVQAIGTTTNVKCTVAVTMSNDVITYGCNGAP